MSVNVDAQYAIDVPNLPDREKLTYWVNSVCQQDVEMTIRMVDDAESSQLNETWRYKSGPTNVLSFIFECPPGINIPLLGDIVICAPLVAREAEHQQKSLEAHWAHLVIHGTLHLLGYDHLEETERQLMERLEIQALYNLGYPHPYEMVTLS
ncbi:MAG: rRNA maturation RNase YbeY [Thiomargarita sp.]|nr:rRNA maturation RNase YbeY [Thiomargarita sp.]